MPTPINSSVDPLPVRSRKRLVVPAVVVALAAAGGYAWYAAGGDDRARATALAAARDHQFARAEPLLREALARNPDDVEVLDALAGGYLDAGRPADALGPLTGLVALRPNDERYLRLRADAYLDTEDWDRACADLDRLAELAPDAPHPRRAALGQALAAGRLSRAEALCRAALRAQPADRTLRLMLAEIRWLGGDEAESGRLLDELIREDPTDLAARMARGTLYEEAGEPDRAIADLREVFTRDPAQKRAAGFRLGRALARTGRADEARAVLAEAHRALDAEVYADATARQPNNLEMRVRFAEAILRDGYAPDGVEMIEAVLRQAPKYGPAHRVLASYYARTGRPDLADRHREAANGSP